MPLGVEEGQGWSEMAEGLGPHYQVCGKVEGAFTVPGNQSRKHRRRAPAAAYLSSRKSGKGNELLWFSPKQLCGHDATQAAAAAMHPGAARCIGESVRRGEQLKGWKRRHTRDGVRVWAAGTGVHGWRCATRAAILQVNGKSALNASAPEMASESGMNCPLARSCSDGAGKGCCSKAERQKVLFGRGRTPQRLGHQRLC